MGVGMSHALMLAVQDGMGDAKRTKWSNEKEDIRARPAQVEAQLSTQTFSK